MAAKYADRIFMSVNGQEIADLQSITIKQNRNRRPVPIMSRNRRNKGYVEGNLNVDVTATLAVQNQLARPKFEDIDYETNDIQITAIFGSDQLVLHDVVLNDNDDSGSGPGDEVKSTFNFFALDITDPVGNSDLLTIQLA